MLFIDYDAFFDADALITPFISFATIFLRRFLHISLLLRCFASPPFLATADTLIADFASHFDFFAAIPLFIFALFRFFIRLTPFSDAAFFLLFILCYWCCIVYWLPMPMLRFFAADISLAIAAFRFLSLFIKIRHFAFAIAFFLLSFLRCFVGFLFAIDWLLPWYYFLIFDIAITMLLCWLLIFHYFAFHYIFIFADWRRFLIGAAVAADFAFDAADDATLFLFAV